MNEALSFHCALYNTDITEMSTSGRFDSKVAKKFVLRFANKNIFSSKSRRNPISGEDLGYTFQKSIEYFQILSQTRKRKNASTRAANTSNSFKNSGNETER